MCTWIASVFRCVGRGLRCPGRTLCAIVVNLYEFLSWLCSKSEKTATRKSGYPFVDPVAVVRPNRLYCPVCIDAIQEPMATRCGHVFCRSCIDLTMKPNRKTVDCPMCKKRVCKKDLLVLYPYLDE
ncbi:unnamed protein product [Aphanomyces euteiches]